MTGGMLFATAVRTPRGKAAARLLIQSLQAFGGEMSACPVWVFAIDPRREPCRDLAGGQVQVEALEVPASLASSPFGGKVAGCARAEELAASVAGSMVWIDPACLVVQPPSQFDLGTRYDAAFRPVHIRNVGLPCSEPLDAFWKGIYARVGVDELPGTVVSFVDGVTLRTYYNSHAFAVNPALRLMHAWYRHFEALLADRSYQSTACADEDHQVFLFQALLSTIIAASVDPARVCALPTTYNYPYHLQERIPAGRRYGTLNETVCFTYEDCSLAISELNGIQVRAPLSGWMEHNVTKS